MSVLELLNLRIDKLKDLVDTFVKHLLELFPVLSEKMSPKLQRGMDLTW